MLSAPFRFAFCVYFGSAWCTCVVRVRVCVSVWHHHEPQCQLNDEGDIARNQFKSDSEMPRTHFELCAFVSPPAPLDPYIFIFYATQNIFTLSP